MHDKKSDHYTSAKNYTDLDGLSKSFTFVDHDIKTKISTPVKETPFQRDWRILEEFIETFKDDPNYGIYVDELKEEYGYVCYGYMYSLARKLGYNGDLGT